MGLLALGYLTGRAAGKFLARAKRAISFGDSMDYYSTGSGTNILSWNYTFEIVEVYDCVLVVEGYGGCISVVGVDMR